MNAYLNHRNERARWRRMVHRLRLRGSRYAASYLWDLQMLGVLDRRNGGYGVPDNVAVPRLSRSARQRNVVNQAWQRANQRKYNRANARSGEPF